MKNYIIKIHSFVDLITNSSSEIFVRANDKTIETIKQLINGLLKMANSELTADDLFEFKLIISSYYDDNDKMYKNIDPDSNEGKEILQNSDESGRGVNVKIIVKPKIMGDENSELVAKILSNLTSLFVIAEMDQ